MMFSERIMKVKPSPTLEVTALAAALKARGVDVIDFGSGEPDFDTPDFIKKAAIDAINSGKTKYTPVGGINELKAAITAKFKRDNNLNYSAGEVIVNCGGKHSFYNLMQVLLNDGDEVIIPAPYWVSFPPMVSLAGGNPVIIDTTAESGFKVTPSMIEEKITGKTRALVLNSPSNPTGTAYTAEELKAIASVIEKKDILIISDDIYESIIFDDFRFSNTACISEELRKKTIVLNGVSKTYAMTGWRIGYMAAPADIIKKVESLQSQSTSNPTSISQWAAVAALNGDQSVIDSMLEAFRRRRDLTVNALRAIDGIDCIKPDGAFYAFPGIKEMLKFPGWKGLKEKYKSDYNSSSLSSYLLEEANVAVVPGIAFGNDDHFRISFATSDKNLTDGIERINKAVSRLK